MDVESIVRKHVAAGQMMQVATVVGDQPWVCTLYYVPDNKLNLYWISTPDRRHSKELIRHRKVAGAIPIKYVYDQPVVGLQFEGEAELVSDSSEIKKVMRLYADRYKRSEEWYADFLAGKNPHKPYRIKPTLFVLFDEEAFPGGARREWKPAPYPTQ